MKPVRIPFFLRWFSPSKLLCELPENEKVIYLTFDDGPIPEATPEVLHILEKWNAKATFFMVGDDVRKFPSLFEEVKNGGHSFGNHTFHHLNGWKTSTGAYLEDVERCNVLVKSKLFRPPYGRFSISQYFMLRSQYRFVLWSVLSLDFDRNITPEQCLKIVMDHTKPGSIVVFHDSIKAIEKVRYALPRVLEHFSWEGYRIEGLSHLDK